MKRFYELFMLSALLAAGAVAESNHIGWERSYSAAIAKAKRSGKPVLIYFFGTRDQYSKFVDVDFYYEPDVLKAVKGFVPYKQNGKTTSIGRRLAKEFSVAGFPKIFCVDGNGKFICNIPAYTNPKDFANAIAMASTIPKEYATLKARLSVAPADYDALVKFVGFEAAMGKANDAMIRVALRLKSETGSKRARLLDAYNALGDALQTDGSYDEAIKVFAKAIEPGFDRQTAYAKISIASSYCGKGEFTAARPYAEAVLKIGNITDAERGCAQGILHPVITMNGKVQDSARMRIDWIRRG